jgi:hypothetical protein
LFENLESGHAGEHEVEHDQRGTILLRQSQGIGTVTRG